MSTQGEPTAANALLMLFRHGQETLPDESLDWLADLGDCIKVMADGLKKRLGRLAILAADGNLASHNGLQISLDILGMASMAETIAALDSDPRGCRL